MGYLGAFYRTYALDFWGFGESGKKRETYAVSDFVSLVDQFMSSWVLSMRRWWGIAWVVQSAFR